ncbi:MAG: hypothetical protein K8T90_19435 [Planctomycetes bacterium]|nr:hypothetical protein [Planctomycetota bacterium]
MSMSMRSNRKLALTALALFALVATMSSRTDAQDQPLVPPKDETPVAPAAPVAPTVPQDEPPPSVKLGPDGEALPTDEEDAAARKLLTAAADHQGGATLSAPDGKLESFHVVFHKVTVFRPRDDGTRQKMDSETPGLIVDWKGQQIRTEWHLTGEGAVIRGVETRKSPRDGSMVERAWLFDGTKSALLTPQLFAKDLEEVSRDRKIVKVLLEVAVLRAMLSDGSRWKIVDDPAFEGVSVRRTPPANAETPLKLTLWLDQKTNDVTGAKLAPNEPGESTMYYGLSYHPEFPKVKGDVLRFPFKFKVREQRIAEQEPMDVMEAAASEVSFNDVEDATFKPPVTKPAAEK